MIVYNIYIVMVILLAVIISCARKKFRLSEDNRIIIDNKLNIDMLCKLGFCILAFGYLIFLASQRYDVGFDYFQYTLAYEEIARCDSFGEALRLHNSYEPGYVAFEYLLSRLFVGYKSFLLIHSMLVTGVFAVAVFCNSKNVYFSALLYLVLNIYAISLNFSRQAIAIAILLAGFEMLRREQYLRYILVIILAATFHLSALVMLAFIAICFFKPNKHIYIGIITISMIVLAFSNQIIDLLCRIFKKYSYYKDSFYLKIGGSTKPFVTFLILSVLVLVCYFFTSWREESEQSRLYVRVALICAILSVYMRKHYIFDRFAYYFIMWFILIIPDLLSYLYCKFVNSLRAVVNRIKKNKSLKLFFRYLSFYKAMFSAVTVITIVFSIAIYYNYSINDGSHKAYLYQSFNQGLSNLVDYKKSDEEILKTTTSFPQYLEMLNNDDYIVACAYYNDWITLHHYNDVFMSVAQESIETLGLMDIFEVGRTSAYNKSGSFIIDGGELVASSVKGFVSYDFGNVSMCAYGKSSEKWIGISGIFVDETNKSMDVIVYSKSRNEIIDYCQILQGTQYYAPTLYHNNLDNLHVEQLNSNSSYKDVVMSMFDSKNIIILYNNNEDFEGEVPLNPLDKYFDMLGSTITIDALCNQNVVAMRFGGEWREIMYPASPAQIEAEIDGVSYDIYADSYKSYCKINGVEVSSGDTGLNVIIISPEGEILFNGSIDIYSGYNEVTVNSVYAQIT